MFDWYHVRDWLGQEPPYAFRWDHILFIVLSILVAVGLIFLLRNKDKKTQKLIYIILWIISIGLIAFDLSIAYIEVIMDPANHSFNIESMLPLHSCYMFMYIFPIAIFVKNKIIYKATNNFLVIINMIIGFITLFVGCVNDGKSALSWPGMVTLIYHAIIFVVPLVMVGTRYYDIELWDIKYGVALFGILSIIMWTFDAFTGCDYFYFYDGHTFPVLKVISENVHHLVWTLIVVSCYVITGFATHFLIIWIKSLLLKNKAKTA